MSHYTGDDATHIPESAEPASITLQLPVNEWTHKIELVRQLDTGDDELIITMKNGKVIQISPEYNAINAWDDLKYLKSGAYGGRHMKTLDVFLGGKSGDQQDDRTPATAEELKDALRDVMKYVSFARGGMKPGMFSTGIEKAEKLLAKG